MTARAIAPVDIFQVWDAMRVQIARALEHGKGENSPCDILECLQSGAYQGWEHDGSYAVTRIIDYPNYRVCRIIYAGGKMDDASPILEAIESWALQAGCRAVEIQGRPGWSRLPGYERYSVISRKEIENDVSLL